MNDWQAVRQVGHYTMPPPTGQLAQRSAVRREWAAAYFFWVNRSFTCEDLVSLHKQATDRAGWNCVDRSYKPGRAGKPDDFTTSQFDLMVDQIVWKLFFWKFGGGQAVEWPWNANDLETGPGVANQPSKRLRIWWFETEKTNTQDFHRAWEEREAARNAAKATEASQKKRKAEDMSTATPEATQARKTKSNEVEKEGASPKVKREARDGV